MITIRRPWYKIEVLRDAASTSLAYVGLDRTLHNYARARAGTTCTLLSDHVGASMTSARVQDTPRGAVLLLEGQAAAVERVVVTSRVLCGHADPGTFMVAPAPGSHLPTCSRCRARVVTCSVCDARESAGPHLTSGGWKRWSELVADEPWALLPRAPMGSVPGTARGTGRQVISGHACPSCEYVPSGPRSRAPGIPGSLGPYPGDRE